MAEDLGLGPGGAEAVDGAEVVEQLLVLPEDAAGATVGDDALENADREMGLAKAAQSGKEQALAGGLDGKPGGELPGGGKRLLDALGRGAVERLITVELAELVAAGDAGILEQARGAQLDAAGAVLGKLAAVVALDDGKPKAMAERARRSHTSVQYGSPAAPVGRMHRIAAVRIWIIDTLEALSVCLRRAQTAARQAVRCEREHTVCKRAEG